MPQVIDDQCIQMCSRKVANVSGDLRKAFQVGKKRGGSREGGYSWGREGQEALEAFLLLGRGSPVTGQ